jgi:putative ABC transport system permease protein
MAFDLLLVAPDYVHLSKAGTIPRARLTQAASLPEVEGTSSLDVGFNLWRGDDENHQRRGILVMALDPTERVIDLPELQAQQTLLEKPGTVLSDRLSRAEFGPMGKGVSAEVGRTKVRVGGQFTLGTGFSADGAIVTSDETFRRLFPNRKPGVVSLGLIRLKPGTDPDAVAEKLGKILPRDVHVYTRAEIEAHERHHWMIKTSVGIIFGFGVLVALFVGTAIVYQVLSSDIASHLGEYATLKAMGYTRRYLSWLVLEQALILGVAGFVPGLILAVALYQLTRYVTHVPVEMTLERGIGVLVLSVTMCGLSGLASSAKVQSADPADLF